MQINHRIDIVKLLPAHSVAVEVGCAEGLFSRDLLDAGVERLFMVDNWGHIPYVTGDGNFDQDWHDKNYSMAVNRVMQYGCRAKQLKGMSVEMADKIEDESVDLVYLDAAHFYDGVLADLKAFYPKLKSGGIMAGHDFLNDDYQVKQAVIDFASHNPSIVINTIPENNIKDASFFFIKL